MVIAKLAKDAQALAKQGLRACIVVEHT